MSDPGLDAYAAQLRNGEISAVQLAQDSLTRARQQQDAYNLFVNLADEQAVQQAQVADAAIQQGDTSTLAGIPYVAKDIFCSKDLATTCASKMLANFVAPYDATALARIKEKGGVLIGKTNMDEFAMGSSSEQSHYGAVANPWQLDHVAGGSSGGSAVAVATGLVPYALGTDTGGSVRQPAAFCGVCGLKPTYGRISRYGMVAYASSLDQAGVFARRATDLAVVLEALSGIDARDSTSADRPVPNWSAQLSSDNDLKAMTLGLVVEFMEQLDDDMRAVLQQAIDVLVRCGAKIVEVQLPQLRRAIACYYTLALAEASSNLARYDGVCYGYRAEDAADLQDMYVRSRSEGFGDEVKRRILLGTYVLTAGYYDAYYRRAQQVRRLIRDDFMRAFVQVDLLVGPVTPRPAFVKQEKPDVIEMYKQDIYTVPANLAGLPAMSVPIGFVDDLPVGMQLLANHFEEAHLLRAAHAYQQVTDWHTKMPPTQH